VTTRIAKTTRGSRTPTVTLMCPACRCVRRARPVGTAVIGGKRREVLQCAERTCELEWVPTKAHIPKPALQAA
jgi:hypothetical protein